MSEERYIFPKAQAEFLRAYAAGEYRACVAGAGRAARANLRGGMPPVYQQALRGTCAANAVTALLEYYWDCRTKLSVQYLFAQTKEIEREGVERNLERLRAGEELDAEFEAVFHSGVVQLRLMAEYNGGMGSAQMEQYVREFERGVRERFAGSPGCLLRTCFAAVERHGICRHSLWPYAAAAAAPMFGEVERGATFPPGAREDAAKRKVGHGLYLLGAPNNAGEIRGILAGENGRRAMPVAVTLSTFEGCDGETYRLPDAEEAGDGRLAAKQKWNGRHAVLLVGYEDNAKYAGGGYFTLRNSFGEGWGDGGYGKLPYAYLECFAGEAGTILQDMVDYAGDGYGGTRRAVAGGSGAGRWPRWAKVAGNLAIGAVISGLTLAAGVWFNDPLGLHKRHEARGAGGAAGVGSGAVTNGAVAAEGVTNGVERVKRKKTPKPLVMFDLRGLVDEPEALEALEDLTGKTFESCGVVPVRIGEEKLRRVLGSGELEAAGIEVKKGGKKGNVYQFRFMRDSQ